MNAQRRKEIQQAQALLEGARDTWQGFLDSLPPEPEGAATGDAPVTPEGTPPVEVFIEKWQAFCASVDDARGDLETLRDEEQDYYDNMPEGFKQGSRGDAAQSAIDALETAISQLENISSTDIEDAPQALSDLEDALANIEEAAY